MTTPTTSATVALRPAEAGDDYFLRALYRDTHPELAGLTSALATDLIELQITAQRRQYAAAHPASVEHVIERDGEPVGRCWTATSDSELRVLDLAVLTGHQRRGIGRAVVRDLVRAADDGRRVVRLSVWAENHSARELYLSTGFTLDVEDNGYLHLSRPATPDPGGPSCPTC